MDAINYQTEMDIVNEEINANKFQVVKTYPNPFNPVTTIRYDLPEDAKIIISVYDIIGREIKTLIKTKVVAITTKVICLAPSTDASFGDSPLSKRRFNKCFSTFIIHGW